MSRISAPRYRPSHLLASLLLALGLLLPWPGMQSLAQTGCLPGLYLAQYYNGSTTGGTPVLTRYEVSVNYD